MQLAIKVFNRGVPRPTTDFVTRGQCTRRIARPMVVIVSAALILPFFA